MQAILLAAVLSALPSGGRVPPASGFPVPDSSPRPLQHLAAVLDRADVPGRDPKKIREWRDQNQTYSIIWLANDKTFARYGLQGAYRAYKIEGDHYAQLPDANNDIAVVEPTFEDAMTHIKRHYRLMKGLRKIDDKPSPKKKRLMDAGLWRWSK